MRNRVTANQCCCLVGLVVLCATRVRTLRASSTGLAFRSPWNDVPCHIATTAHARSRPPRLRVTRNAVTNVDTGSSVP